MTQPTPPLAQDTTQADNLPPSPGGSQVVAEFDSYADAQRLVDRLSDAGFPVEHVRIVGTGIQSVEQVTGRLTTSRAALAGAASGAWFGLLIGLILGLFADGSGWLAVILSGLVIGALWGAAFGFVAQWATRGRRDFASVTALQAQRYFVQVDSSHVAEAARIVGAT